MTRLERKVFESFIQDLILAKEFTEFSYVDR